MLVHLHAAKARSRIELQQTSFENELLLGASLLNDDGTVTARLRLCEIVS